MKELVAREESGIPIFGQDSIRGWAIERLQETTTERTLRNAILAALFAEHSGNTAKAYKIWTHQLRSGETVWQAVANALPYHVAALGGAQAGYTWTKAGLQQRINEISDALGTRPAVGHWGTGGVTVVLYEWPGSNTWLGVERNSSGMFRLTRARPRSPHKSSVRDRLEIDCDAPHIDNAIGAKVCEPHSLAECHEPTMADRMGIDLPSDAEMKEASDAHVTPEVDKAHKPRPEELKGKTYGAAQPLWPNADDIVVLALSRAQGPVTVQSGPRLTAPQIMFLLQLHPQSMESPGKTQRKASRYRACEICKKAVMHDAHGCNEEAGRYCTITGRRRAHLACAREAHAKVARLVQELKASKGSVACRTGL